MELEKVLNKLSEELSIQIQNKNFSAIKLYLQYALVVGLEQPIASHKKTILMLDDNNNLIKQFDRLIDAVLFLKEYKELKTKKETIYVQIWRVLQGQKNVAYSYHWKYK